MSHPDLTRSPKSGRTRRCHQGSANARRTGPRRAALEEWLRDDPELARLAEELRDDAAPPAAERAQDSGHALAATKALLRRDPADCGAAQRHTVPFSVSDATRAA